MARIPADLRRRPAALAPATSGLRIPQAAVPNVSAAAGAGYRVGIAVADTVGKLADVASGILQQHAEKRRAAEVEADRAGVSAEFAASALRLRQRLAATTNLDEIQRLVADEERDLSAWLEGTGADGAPNLRWPESQQQARNALATFRVQLRGAGAERSVQLAKASDLARIDSLMSVARETGDFAGIEQASRLMVSGGHLTAEGAVKLRDEQWRKAAEYQAETALIEFGTQAQGLAFPSAESAATELRKRLGEIPHLDRQNRAKLESRLTAVLEARREDERVQAERERVAAEKAQRQRVTVADGQFLGSLNAQEYDKARAFLTRALAEGTWDLEHAERWRSVLAAEEGQARTAAAAAEEEIQSAAVTRLEVLRTIGEATDQEVAGALLDMLGDTSPKVANQIRPVLSAIYSQAKTEADQTREDWLRKARQQVKDRAEQWGARVLDKDGKDITDQEDRKFLFGYAKRIAKANRKGPDRLSEDAETRLVSEAYAKRVAERERRYRLMEAEVYRTIQGVQDWSKVDPDVFQKRLEGIMSRGATGYLFQRAVDGTQQRPATPAKPANGGASGSW